MGKLSDLKPTTTQLPSWLKKRKEEITKDETGNSESSTGKRPEA